MTRRLLRRRLRGILPAAALGALLTATATPAEPPSLAEKALRQLRVEQAYEAGGDAAAERRERIGRIEAKAAKQRDRIAELLELLERIANRLSIRAQGG